jgi:hypothetical protein
VEEIERAYLRGNLYNEGGGAIEKEFAEKPNCLLSHQAGGVSVL